MKNPPATLETWVQSLGQEDPLEGGHDDPPWILLLDSCLENPMDRGAWGTTTHEASKESEQLSTHNL